MFMVEDFISDNWSHLVYHILYFFQFRMFSAQEYSKFLWNLMLLQLELKSQNLNDAKFNKVT